MGERLLNDDEQAAFDKIVEAYKAIGELGPNRLIANHAELVAAVHVLQTFVLMHAAYRLDPDNWARWYL